ncbi:hypothetical protein BLA29_014912, partial [Euroglyphus maynei]
PRSKRSRRTNPTADVTTTNEKKKIELNIDSIVDNDNDDDDLIGPDEDLSGVIIDDETENELHQVLHKARKIKLKEKISDQALAVARLVKREMKPDETTTSNQSTM